MRNTVGPDIETSPDDRNDAYRTVVSDLVSLTEHVQTILKRIETAIARESSPGDDDASSNVIVLDDVTPCYVKASAALKACDANLGIALDFLQDSRRSKRGAKEFAEGPPALAVVGA